MKGAVIDRIELGGVTMPARASVLVSRLGMKKLKIICLWCQLSTGAILAKRPRQNSFISAISTFNKWTLDIWVWAGWK